MEETTSQKPSVIGESKKANRLRSVAYPSYTIESCVNFTKRVDKEFTTVRYTPKEAIAETLGTSGGAFLMQLSTCVQYGLLDLKQKEGYKPTGLFKKIEKPLEGENPNDFLNECLNRPPLYKKLLTDFKDKQLPSEIGLANMLDRNFGVKGGAATIAARIFLKNVKSLGLITEGNLLKIDSYITFVEATNDNETLTSPPVKEMSNFLLTQTSNIKEFAPKFSTREIPVFYGVDREAKAILPADFTNEELKKFIKVLSGYLE